MLKKKKNQIDKAHFRLNQERRLEIQIQMKEAQERIEQMRKKKVDDNLRTKEKEVNSEQKRIKQKEKQAKKLELLEAEILQRLKETHQ